jgi:hypothetical protein
MSRDRLGHLPRPQRSSQRLVGARDARTQTGGEETGGPAAATGPGPVGRSPEAGQRRPGRAQVAKNLAS